MTGLFRKAAKKIAKLRGSKKEKNEMDDKTS